MSIDKGNALFIVESPFQLICAFEALNFFGYKKYHIIVRLSGKDVNDKQMKDVVRLYRDENISYIFFRNSNESLMENLISLVKVLIKIVNKKEIYIGNAESKFLSLVTRFCSQPVRILDDGTKTLYLAESERYRDNLFFTMFDLKGKQVKYVEHKFSKLNSIVCGNKVSRSFSGNYFLGSDISEIKLVTEVAYIDMVKEIINKHQGSWVYIAHRNESEDKLEVISKKLNMEVKRLKYPIEFIGYECGSIPKLVCSFYSTALISLNKIYQVDVFSYRLDRDFNINKNIERVYNQCSKYIPVVNI
ncbi:TPA: hypothetical protein ACN33Q_000859 [Vibrio parahaemolyticus]|nr:hypothetical protein [Vibrio parahaemolyticus]HCG8199118.1 hypothetical protein [Vibrio parahaemolyticus]